MLILSCHYIINDNLLFTIAYCVIGDYVYEVQHSTSLSSRRYLIINVLLIKMLNTAYCSGVMLNILQSQTEKSKTPVEEVAIIKLIRNISFFNFMMPYTEIIANIS